MPYRLLYNTAASVNGYPKLISGDGDGTVNLRSLEGCLYWKDKQKKNIYHQPFPKVDHMQILKDLNVLNYIRTTLNYKKKGRKFSVI